MTRAVLVLGSILFLATAASAQQHDVLTLDDALALALANNRQLQSAMLAEQRAANDVAVARSRRLPVFSSETQLSRLLKPVDITFPEGAFGNFPATGPVPSTDTTITTPARMTVQI